MEESLQESMKQSEIKRQQEVRKTFAILRGYNEDFSVLKANQKQYMYMMVYAWIYM